MNHVIMFEKLREYLTKEYIRLSEEKEEILSRKVSLEEKERQSKDLFFDAKKIESRKRLFYAIEESLFEYADRGKEEAGKNNTNIQKLEKDIDKIDSSLHEIKEYITFLQTKVKEKEDTFGVSDDLKDMILTVAAFLQSQYPNIEFLTDFEEEDLITSVNFNGNLIRILTYTISSTIESAQMDSVIIDVKKAEEKINITLYMLLDDKVLDYYTYEFHFGRENHNQK